MTVHMIKLCVGVDSIEDLSAWQKMRLAHGNRVGDRRLFHATRMIPKRKDELADGGSIFWVMKGVVQVRQRITGFDDGERPDGTRCCLIQLDPKLVPVRPTPRRPFQGWRYLKVEDAPADLAPGAADDVAQMPAAMRRQLADLGLL